MASIFVQIASYSDNELSPTIKDLLDTASGENTINFGVHLCLYPGDEVAIPELSCVKSIVSHAPNNLGVGIARSLAHSLYDGEDYYFQIDSHSRMDKNWDSYLIEQVKYYQSIGFKKPLITNYPRKYKYTGETILKFGIEVPTQMRMDEDPPGQFKALLIPKQIICDNPKGNIFSTAISGGCLFTTGGFIEPKVLAMQFGEEIVTAARAFTHGFDLLLPSKCFMYHLYMEPERDPDPRNLRRLIWEDYPNEFSKLNDMAREQILNLFKNRIVGPEAFGSERTLDEYEEYAGLNFRLGEIVRKDGSVVYRRGLNGYTP
jgi:hypothetical protein